MRLHTPRSSRTPLVSLILVALVIALSHASAWAQDTGAILLTFPVHPRLISMGQTGVADNSDPSTVYYNPANAVANPRVYLLGSQMRWSDDVWFSSDLSTSRGNAGFSWQGDGASPLTWGADFTLAKFDYGEIIATLPNGSPVGTFNAFEKVASLALAVGIPCGSSFDVRVGVAAKRWWAEFGMEEFTQDNIDVSPDAYAFDAGVTGVMRTTVGEWSVNPALAVAMIDAGPDYEVVTGEQDDPLPMRLNFGASVRVESPAHHLGGAKVPIVALTANVDGTEPRHGDFEWGLGTELAIADILFVRTGAHMLHLDDDEDESLTAWGIGLGIPVSSLRVRFDYSASDYYYVKDHMGVTLTWVF